MNIYSVSYYKRFVKYNQVIKRFPYICYYNYQYKSCTMLWYRLNKSKINRKNIKKRYRFKEDPEIDKRYRATLEDYKYSGYDRGHLASDSSFDYNKKVLKNTYYLSNVIPQKPIVNRYIVEKIERYERYVTTKLGYLYVVCLNKFGNVTIGDNLYVPKTMYKILISNKYKFIRIFRYTQKDNNKPIKHFVITMEEFLEDWK